MNTFDFFFFFSFCGNPELHFYSSSLSKCEFFLAGVVDVFDELTWKYLTGILLMFTCRKQSHVVLNVHFSFSSQAMHIQMLMVNRKISHNSSRDMLGFIGKLPICSLILVLSATC